MSVRCPACGFDSPDEARWCDFCKEPFRKKEAPAAAAPPPAAAAPRPLAPEPEPRPAPEPSQPVDPRVEQLAKQLSVTGDGLKLPALPPYFKYLAWAFFGAWFFTGAVLGGIMLARYHERQAARQADPSQPHIQIIRTP